MKLHANNSFQVKVKQFAALITAVYTRVLRNRVIGLIAYRPKQRFLREKIALRGF